MRLAGSFAGTGSERVRWVLLTASVMLALGGGFVWLEPATAGEALRRVGYGLMTGTVLLFVWSLGRDVGGAAWTWIRAMDPREHWQRWREAPGRSFQRSPVAMVLGGSLLAVLAEPTGFKILFDEYVLQATASQLHLTREVGTMVRAYEVEGVWLPLNQYIDKRPYFFAYLLATLHDLTGFRPSNAFWLNHALTAGLFALVYAITRRLTARPECGVLAGWWLAGLPLLGQNTNGSGMELLNVVMILVAWWLGMRLVARPAAVRQDGFLLAVILLAQCRYESALFVVLAAGVLGMAWWREGRVRLTAVTLLAPLLLLPVAWLHQVFGENQLLWQLPEDLSAPFGTQHVGGNLERAVGYFFSVNPRQSSSLLLSVAGGAGLALLSVVWWRRRRDLAGRGDLAVAGLFSVGVAANLVLLMHYFWGQLDDPLVSRLSLPFQVLLAMGAAGAAGWYGRARPAILRTMLIVALVSLPLIYGRAVPQRPYTQENILEQEIRWELDWVARQPPGPRLVVTNKTNLAWLLTKTPALLINQAAPRGEAFRFHLVAGTFQEILIMQRWRPMDEDGNYALSPDEALPDHFHLEVLAQRRFGISRATISRLVRVDAVEPAPPVKDGNAEESSP